MFISHVGWWLWPLPLGPNQRRRRKPVQCPSCQPARQRIQLHAAGLRRPYVAGQCGWFLQQQLPLGAGRPRLQCAPHRPLLLDVSCLVGRYVRIYPKYLLRLMQRDDESMEEARDMNSYTIVHKGHWRCINSRTINCKKRAFLLLLNFFW